VHADRKLTVGAAAAALHAGIRATQLATVDTRSDRVIFEPLDA
jgi:hypothetical protein